MSAGGWAVPEPKLAACFGVDDFWEDLALDEADEGFVMPPLFFDCRKKPFTSPFDAISVLLSPLSPYAVSFSNFEFF